MHHVRISRLPCVWDNKGNLENLMFDENDDPVAIDSLISCFDPSVAKDAFATYIDRVRELVHHVHASADQESAAMKRIRDVFLKSVSINTGTS